MELDGENCGGTLVFHQDWSVSCSERICLANTLSEWGLGNHACVMSCREPVCAQCAGDAQGSLVALGQSLRP